MEKNCERLLFYPFAIIDRNRAISLGVNYEADSWLHFGRHFEKRRRYRAL